MGQPVVNDKTLSQRGGGREKKRERRGETEGGRKCHNVVAFHKCLRSYKYLICVERIL